jgi:hypothetical protein
VNTATTTPTALRVIKRPDRPAELPGVEVEELTERDSGFALSAHFGLPEFEPAQSPPELQLLQTERSVAQAQVQLFVMRSKKDGGVGQ